MTTPTYETIVLESRDETRFSAYAARAAKPTGAGIVILPGGRGLLPTYAALAERFGSAGIDAVAIDPFGRSPEPVLGMRDEEFEFAPHLAKTSPDYTRQDVAAALEYLRSGTGGAVRTTFTIGFSFGGAASFLQAVHAEHRLAGVIGCYGWPSGSTDFPQWPQPVEQVKKYSCPVLAIFGGADERIPMSEAQQFDAALGKASVEHWMVICDGALHGFVDRRAKEFPAQAQVAWQRIVAFVNGLTPAA
ncbi:MAG: dienelactone hydrolase family protein [Nitrospirota bacterium]